MAAEAAIVETITKGRQNVMPAWKEFLGDGKVHVIAGYVYSLRLPAKRSKQYAKAGRHHAVPAFFLYISRN